MKFTGRAQGVRGARRENKKRRKKGPAGSGPIGSVPSGEIPLIPDWFLVFMQGAADPSAPSYLQQSTQPAVSYGRTLKESSKIVRAWIEHSGVGGTSYMAGNSGWVRDDSGYVVAYISYNGRVWYADHTDSEITGAPLQMSPDKFRGWLKEQREQVGILMYRFVYWNPGNGKEVRVEVSAYPDDERLVQRVYEGGKLIDSAELGHNYKEAVDAALSFTFRGAQAAGVSGPDQVRVYVRTNDGRMEEERSPYRKKNPYDPDPGVTLTAAQQQLLLHIYHNLQTATELRAKHGADFDALVVSRLVDDGSGLANLTYTGQQAAEQLRGRRHNPGWYVAVQRSTGNAVIKKLYDTEKADTKVYGPYQSRNAAQDKLAGIAKRAAQEAQASKGLSYLQWKALGAAKEAENVRFADLDDANSYLVTDILKEWELTQGQMRRAWSALESKGLVRLRYKEQLIEVPAAGRGMLERRWKWAEEVLKKLCNVPGELIAIRGKISRDFYDYNLLIPVSRLRALTKTDWKRVEWLQFSAPWYVTKGPAYVSHTGEEVVPKGFVQVFEGALRECGPWGQRWMSDKTLDRLRDQMQSPTQRRNNPVQSSTQERRENPGLAILNPLPAKLQAFAEQQQLQGEELEEFNKAIARYCLFHGVDAEDIEIEQVGETEGDQTKFLVGIGATEDVSYSANHKNRYKGSNKQGVPFRHEFPSKPHMATTPDGDMILIINRAAGKQFVVSDWMRG